MDIMQQERHETEQEEILTEEETTLRNDQIPDEKEKRRELRKEYLKLIEETDSNKTEIIKTGSVKRRMDIQNQLYSDVTHAREGSLDAQLLKKLGEYQVEQSSKLHVGQQFDSNQFLEKLRIKYSNHQQDVDWTKLGGDVSKHFSKTPQITFMHGPLKVEPKEIKKREKRKRFTQGEAINPDEVSQVTKEKNETTRKVKEIHKKIKKEAQNTDEIPFLNIAIDPNSFTKSIENIFHMGFLVKDGMLTLKSDDDKMVCELTGEESVEDKKKAGGNKQCILKLDLETWKRLKQNK
eukprot:gene9119-1209_t